MRCYSVFDAAKLKASLGHASCVLLGTEQGCPDSCSAGVSVYDSPDFAPAQQHPFHEGFFVAEGDGAALVGDEIFEIHAGTSFFVPKQVQHTLRCTGEIPVKVFWFHAL